MHFNFSFYTSLAWLGDPRRGVGGKPTGPTGQKRGPTGGDCASSGIAFLGPSRAPFRILLLGREGSKQTRGAPTREFGRILPSDGADMCRFPGLNVFSEENLVKHRATGKKRKMFRFRSFAYQILTTKHWLGSWSKVTDSKNF